MELLLLPFPSQEDGSVVLWDLREPWAMHQQQPALRGLETPPRVPTFSTGGLCVCVCVCVCVLGGGGGCVFNIGDFPH